MHARSGGLRAESEEYFISFLFRRYFILVNQSLREVFFYNEFLFITKIEYKTET